MHREIDSMEGDVPSYSPSLARYAMAPAPGTFRKRLARPLALFNFSLKTKQ